MATSALIPVGEYLTTSYRPDCDYVDGEIQERHVGEETHSDLQARLLDLLRTQANQQYVRAKPELRVQVKATRFRVPDVCVRLRPAPREEIIKTPPVLCIEVLSPEDTMIRMREKVRDYLEMGVPEVWIVDGPSRTVTVCKGITAVEQSEGTLAVPRTPIKLAIAEIFGVLDELD
jgi:Uma2 family endonuclease